MARKMMEDIGGGSKVQYQQQGFEDVETISVWMLLCRVEHAELSRLGASDPTDAMA